MTPERYKQLERDFTLNLTDEEQKEGWIFCNCEFDGLLIHKDQPESEFCACLKQRLGGV